MPKTKKPEGATVRYELEEGGRVERKAENRQKNEVYQTCGILRFSSPPPPPPHTHKGHHKGGGRGGGGEGKKEVENVWINCTDPARPHTHTGSVQNRIE
jgi:hypothetical protein